MIQAATRDPFDPSVAWVLFKCLNWSGHGVEGLNTFVDAGELLATRRLLHSHWPPDEYQIATVLLKTAEDWLKTAPKNAALQAVCAGAYLGLDPSDRNDGNALKAAATLPPEYDALAHAVRGGVAYRQNRFAQAAEEFAAALAVPFAAAPVPAGDDPEERIPFVYRPGFALAGLGLPRRWNKRTTGPRAGRVRPLAPGRFAASRGVATP